MTINTDVLKVGERVTVSKDIDLQPYTTVRRGETGTVAVIDHEFVEVALDTHHDGLNDYGNKAWLSREYDQVSEYLTRDDDLQVRATRRRRNYTPAGAWLMAASVCALAVIAAPDLLRAARGPAMVLHDVRLMDDYLAKGEPLRIEVTATRHRACLWTWSSSFSNADTGIVVSYLKEPGAALAADGELHTHIVRVNQPQGLKPGHYVFATVGKGECDHGDVFTMDPPDLKFTVGKDEPQEYGE